MRGVKFLCFPPDKKGQASAEEQEQTQQSFLLYLNYLVQGAVEKAVEAHDVRNEVANKIRHEELLRLFAAAEVRTNAGFARVDADFAAAEVRTNAGFARVEADIDAGFARVDADFAAAEVRTNAGFARVEADIDAGFAAAEVRTNAGFARVDADIDAGFAAAEVRTNKVLKEAKKAVKAAKKEISARLGRIESRLGDDIRALKMRVTLAEAADHRREGSDGAWTKMVSWLKGVFNTLFSNVWPRQPR
jgi:hypothetical protein